MVGTNGHYVSDAKKIEKAAPDLLEKATDLLAEIRKYGIPPIPGCD